MSYKADHWDFLARQIKHWGPYLAVIVPSIFTLISYGWIPIPVWADDYQAKIHMVEARSTKLSKKQKRFRVDLNQVEKRLGKTETRLAVDVEYRNKIDSRLDTISEQLQFLVNDRIRQNSGR